MPRPKWSREIDNLREGRGITQKALADEVSKILGRRVAEKKVNNWAQAHNNLKADELCALADFFGCTPDSILGYTESKAGDKSLQFICDHTGLSDATVSILHEQQQARSLLNGFIDSFLSSGAWKDIITDIASALDSHNVALQEECNTDIRRSTTMIALDKKLGLSAAGYQLDGKPEIPPGTVLLEAYNATDYYVEKAARLFSEYIRKQFLDSYGRSNNKAKESCRRSGNDKEEDRHPKRQDIHFLGRPSYSGEGRTRKASPAVLFW